MQDYCMTTLFMNAWGTATVKHVKWVSDMSLFTGLKAALKLPRTDTAVWCMMGILSLVARWRSLRNCGVLCRLKAMSRVGAVKSSCQQSLSTNLEGFQLIPSWWKILNEKAWRGAGLWFIRWLVHSVPAMAFGVHSMPTMVFGWFDVTAHIQNKHRPRPD